MRIENQPFYSFIDLCVSSNYLVVVCDDGGIGLITMMLIAEIALGAKEFSKVEIPGDGLGSQNQIVLGG